MQRDPCGSTPPRSGRDVKIHDPDDASGPTSPSTRCWARGAPLAAAEADTRRRRAPPRSSRAQARTRSTMSGRGGRRPQRSRGMGDQPPDRGIGPRTRRSGLASLASPRSPRLARRCTAPPLGGRRPRNAIKRAPMGWATALEREPAADRRAPNIRPGYARHPQGRRHAGQRRRIDSAPVDRRRAAIGSRGRRPTPP